MSMLNNFFTVGLRTKNTIARVKEVVPKEFGNLLIFDLLPIFQGQSKVMMLTLYFGSF
jgi:hypothetical protein